MRATITLLLLVVTACGDAGAPGDDDSPSHPFGTHGGYAAGGWITPDRPAPELDDVTAAAYERWKALYLEPACESGQYRIKTAPSTDDYTVSEGHGYGMLLTVLLAGRDPGARRELDGLYAYYAAHPSANDPALMAWAQDAQCGDVEGADSATDGDLDIAYALLLADAQWGSTGAVDYHAAALRIIDAILASEIHPTASSILVGDWVDPSDPHYTGTRPSDFMAGHARAFRAATGEARWDDVIARIYTIVAAIQTSYAPATGLLPDFVVDATGDAPAPAPPSWLEEPTDGDYAYNSCRTPWRLGTDALVDGEPRARDAVGRITAWIRATTGDDPAAVRDGYTLAGDPLFGGNELPFVAPLAVAAMIEPASGSNQPWLDALWDHLAAAGDADYYGDSLKVLSMVVVSDNWWAP